VVVNALEIFRLDAVPREIIHPVELLGDTPDDIFGEHGISVSLFGHILLVGALEERVDLTACRIFHEFDHVLDPEKLPEPEVDLNDAALVMGAKAADFLRAGTDRGDGDLTPTMKSVFCPLFSPAKRQTYSMRLLAPDDGAVSL